MLVTTRVFTAALILLGPVAAQLRLPNVFGDHMVLQRDKPVRVWGQASPGAQVTVRFSEQEVRATADASGAWRVELPKMAASAVGADLTVVSGKGMRTLRDVLVGEVWVCGGQSNMAWALRASRNADLEIASADYDGIRFLRMPKVARSEPQTDFPAQGPKSKEGRWRKAIASEVENCTAVGYYFARRLHRRLRVPVGLIDTSWGGTMAQNWVTRASLEKVAAMKPYLERHDAKVRAWLEAGAARGAQRRFDADTKAWEVRRDAAKASGDRAPRQPRRSDYDDPRDKGQPSGMWNGVGAPIARFTVRGVLFYQGENNSFGESWKPFPETYPLVIADWRAAFGDPKLPFGLIQIAGWSTRRAMSYDMNHHTNVVREVQFKTWRRTPHTGLIVSYDANTSRSIHPGWEQPVGDRSARWALAEVYDVTERGKAIQWRGPVYKAMQVDGSRVRVSFEAETSRGLHINRDVDAGFYVAGADRVFHHARARVIKGGVELWSDAVEEPVAVRYAWSNLPAGGLLNGRGIAAYPFRSDAWPLTPHQSKGEYRVAR